MKLLLIALLCLGGALARIDEWSWLNQVSPNRKIQDNAFRSGREYHYFYNGQLSTGIAGSSKQHSANRIQALVSVAFKSQNHALMQLQNVRVGRMNREIPNPRNIMPFDAFEDVQIQQNLNQKLQRPVKFSYTGGLVHNVQFDSHEDPWSANIKRSVLNLLQVNLQQQRRLDTADETRLTNNPHFNSNNDDKSNFYRVMEETLEGECETVYTIQQQPTSRQSNGQILNVTKSINFEKCNKRPQIKYNFRFADNCPTCNPKYNNDEKFLKSSTVAKYNITGNKQAFLIEGARVDSEYVFTPFNEQANTIVTYVNQTLILVNSGPAQSVAEPQNPIDSDSNMVFTLDWDVAYEKFHMNGDEQGHRQLHDSQQGANKVELAKKFVQKIANQIKEQLDEDILQHFVRLVQLMRMCTEPELEQITGNHETTPEGQQKLQTIIPQALGSCGTKHCTKLLTHKIRQGQINPSRGAAAIKELLHNRVASDSIINELIQLAESEKAQENQRLKQSAWLITGSLINSLCTDNEDQLALETKRNGEKLCPREMKEKYVKILFNKLRQSSKWQDKALMLKAIGNAGLDLSIFELEKIIRQQDGNHPMHVRFEAILALRQMKDSVPKKIQRVLMPVIMDRREYPTLRSTASYILLQTNPERPILDQLAHNLVNEPSHQFASFLYSQMQSYANSTNPCEQQLATEMKLALRHAKKIGGGVGYSKMAHLTMHSQQEQVGLDVDVDAVFSNISAIPRHIGAAVHGNAFGFWQKHLASLNVFNEGLEPLIRQYADDEVMDLFGSGSGDSWSQLLRRHPRSTHNKNEYQQELDDIFSKHLKIRTRDFGHEHENEPKAYLSAAFKGQVVQFLPISKDLVQQLAQDVGSNVFQLEQKLRQGMNIDYTTLAEFHDMQFKIPTTMGMPLAVTMKLPIAWSLKGKLQANVESLKSVKINAQLKPNAVAQLLVKVEAWSPIVNTGVKIKSKAKLFTPIDAQVEINLDSQPISVRASVKPPTQKRDILVLETKPVSYTQNWQQYVRSVEEGNEEKTIMGEEQNRVSTFNKCFGRQILGVELCARGQVHRTPGQSVAGTPFTPFSGPNKIVITSEPGQDAPESIQVKLTGKFQPVSGSEIQKPSFAQFSQSNNQDDSSSSSSSSSQESQEQQQHQHQHQQQHQRQNQQGNSQSHRQQQRQQGQSQQSNLQQVLQQYRNYNVKKGYKTQVHLEVQAGSNRKANVELSHLYDYKQRYGQVQMRVQCQRPNQWEACLNAEAMFPQNPQSTADVKDKKVLANAELNWGQTCNSQNYIQLTTRAERSRQQSEWEKRQNQYQQYNACQNKAWCSPLTQEDFVEKIGQMMKYRVDINYQNVPHGVQNVTNKLYRALKHYYYWQTDVDQITGQNQPNKIRAEVTLDAQTKQRLNVTVQTPKETINIQDLPLSQPLGGVNQKQSVSDQVANYLNDNDGQAQCSITGKHGWQRRSQVETFDGTKFSAPFTNCWVVLSKDCGSQQPKFVVMARKSPHANGELKEVKIVTRRHRIQLNPQNDDGSINIQVNGKPYDPENEPEVTENGQVVAQINQDQSTVQVQLPQTGVEVEFDGYAINIELSQYYQGQQCGLCGHFDLETTDEFRNPDFTEERDLRQFYMNYLIKDGQCQAPQQLNEICESEECDKSSASSSSSSGSSSSSSSSESQQNSESQSNESSESPEHKTKVIQLDGQICFSTTPVPQCDEDESYPVGSKQQNKVAYVCFDQDSQSAEQLQRQARRSSRRNIPALQNRAPSFTRTENIPEKCQKYSKN